MAGSAPVMPAEASRSRRVFLSDPGAHGVVVRTVVWLQVLVRHWMLTLPEGVYGILDSYAAGAGSVAVVSVDHAL